MIDNNDLIIFSCDELLTELERVLNYPHIKKYNVDIPYSLSVIKESTAHFSLHYPLKNYISNDETDNYLIALALQTNSGFITSGDRHILSEKINLEKKYKKLKILTKKEFELRFSKSW